MSGPLFEISVGGLDDVRRLASIPARALRNPRPVGVAAVTGNARVNGKPLIRRRFGLDPAVREAFRKEGSNAYQGRWERYGSEPRYERIKERHGGGKRVGIWRGAKSPLFKTFRANNPDHIRKIDRDGGFRFGSRRGYASTFHAGGPITPFDGVPQPARPILPPPSALAQEVTRAAARLVFAELGRIPGIRTEGVP